jgi:hypothetical protein
LGGLTLRKGIVAHLHQVCFARQAALAAVAAGDSFADSAEGPGRVQR